MNPKQLILQDIEKHSLDWSIECPKCGSLVNAKYALALAPTLGVTILPHFYCHCSRFQVMDPKPNKLFSLQLLVILYSFSLVVLGRIVNLVLRQR